MRMPSCLLPVCIVLALLGMPAHGADSASGYFRKGDTRIDVHHVIAVRNEETGDADSDEIYLFLSDQPLDANAVAAAMDPDDGAREQYGERSGGYVRICLNADGGECGLYYSRNDPSDSFNTSGYGDLSVDRPTPDRVSGRWILREPEDFFGKTYDFDLRFDTAITPAPGTELPVDGGAPGAAYRVYADAVARGDLPALRRLLGEAAQWRLPDDDTDRVKETLKDLRSEQPLQPRILRARRNGNDAVLWIEGVDRDDIKRRGRVSMHLQGNEWTVGEHDVDSVSQ